ncbi:MAG: NAD(P)/FAD-dependent oxidoreductase [Deltaproteobacteria bacterium]|nr:NAD(P)/FAD-dependent oxidoreductase [Deltaproteobacteria bacterium]
MTEARADFDTAVIGAGAVGLAAAASLAASGRSVVIFEARDAIAQVGTSRNSEVIHAGIYYPKQSQKALLCRRGADLLYRRCAERRVDHRRTGKLIVAANDDEVPKLESLLQAALENGVPQICMIDGAELNRLEPAVAGVAALHSPTTGIVDAHGLSYSYLAEAEEHGASLLVRHSVVALEREASLWRVVVRVGEGSDEQSLRCVEIVNAAGLDSDEIAGMAGIDIDQRGYRIHPCKGEYYALAPQARVELRQLIYPVGSAAGAGLGVHATLDLAGRIRFGPNAVYVQEIDYAVDPDRAEEFAEAIQCYLPQIRSEWLTPDFAGMRTKLAGPGEGFRDFVIVEESDAGLAGLVNCIGIESPGLTASGAIGERVVALLDNR